MENQTRPRSSSKFSFRSHKSDAKPKMDLTESSADKKKSRFSTKSKINPNKALDEIQPGAFQQSEASTLVSLGVTQHKDAYGNMIVDPDRTNPTRPRLERPLDTIRSFEAAIDNGYKRRSYAQRAESTGAVPGVYSRRTSMMGNDMPSYNPRHSPASVYGNSRAQSFRAGSTYDSYGPTQVPQRRSMAHRMNTSPLQQTRMSSDFAGIYPVQAYHASHDTVNTTGESSGSHTTEQWGNSTDPSSENSSIDRVHAVKHMDGGDAYGGAAYGRGSPIRGDAIQEENWHGSQHQEGYGAAPLPMQNGMRPGQAYNQPPAQRQVIKLGDGPSSTPSSAPTGPVYPGAKLKQEAAGEAKKGWLKKRFSKSEK